MPAHSRREDHHRSERKSQQLVTNGFHPSIRYRILTQVTCLFGQDRAGSVGKFCQIGHSIMWHGVFGLKFCFTGRSTFVLACSGCCTSWAQALVAQRKYKTDHSAPIHAVTMAAVEEPQDTLRYEPHKNFLCSGTEGSAMTHLHHQAHTHTVHSLGF